MEIIGYAFDHCETETYFHEVEGILILGLREIKIRRELAKIHEETFGIAAGDEKSNQRISYETGIEISSSGIILCDYSTARKSFCQWLPKHRVCAKQYEGEYDMRGLKICTFSCCGT